MQTAGKIKRGRTEPVMQQERGGKKGSRRRELRITLFSDMMKYLITDSEHRMEKDGKSEGELWKEGRQKCMKCNRRGA